MRPGALFVKGLGQAISFAFNPFIAGPILIFNQYAPPEFKSPVLDFLTDYVSESTISRIISFLTFTFWTNIVSRVSSYLAWRVQNNWIEDVYDWKKEIVLITGASSGFGERVTQLLAEKGITVVALDINPLPPTLAALKTVHFYHCDVSAYDVLPDLAAQIRSEVGDPTVLVNNAGIGAKGGIVEKDIYLVQKVININLIANFAMIQQFLPAMIQKNHGHVISIASMASYMAVGGMADYCASKAGNAALHETLRQELRHNYKANKVRTSIVHPSWTKTPLLLADWEKQIRSKRHTIMKLDDVCLPLVDLILSGYSQQLLLPAGDPVIYLLPGLRGWTHWLQETIRDLARLTV